MAISPLRSMAMTPPSPCKAGSSSSTTSRTASRKRAAAEAHARADIVRHGGANEDLAMAGGRHGARAVVRISARADDG